MLRETCDSLTHWLASRPGARPGDLLSVAVDAPALPRAAVALHGLVGSVLVTRGDVLAHRGSGSAWAELGGAQEAVSVRLTLGFCPIWE